MVLRVRHYPHPRRLDRRPSTYWQRRHPPHTPPCRWPSQNRPALPRTRQKCIHRRHRTCHRYHRNRYHRRHCRHRPARNLLCRHLPHTSHFRRRYHSFRHSRRYRKPHLRIPICSLRQRCISPACIRILRRRCHRFRHIRHRRRTNHHIEVCNPLPYRGRPHTAPCRRTGHRHRHSHHRHIPDHRTLFYRRGCTRPMDRT
jgi:hypothetical protein